MVTCISKLKVGEGSDQAVLGQISWGLAMAEEFVQVYNYLIGRGFSFYMVKIACLQASPKSPHKTNVKLSEA